MGPQWDRDERCYTPGPGEKAEPELAIIRWTPGGEGSPGLSMVSNPRAGELRALVVPLEKVILIRIVRYSVLVLYLKAVDVLVERC